MYGWASKITGVDYSYKHGIDLGYSPAAVGMSSGMFYLNADIWPFLDEDEKFFVICHEWAHIKGQTQDEDLTDAIAFEYYKKTGRSLKQSIYALAKILSWTHPRVEAQLHRARKADGLE